MAELNVANRTLFHGDNLDFLRGINSGTVHLIATDPPFNKNRDFHATPNLLGKGASFPDRWRWDKDVHETWVDSIRDNWPGVWAVIEAARVSYGDDMGAFLCWLGVRLLEMRRILRDDGSLYLHIDHTAHAYTKAMLDAIFGAKNFRNEIVWKRTSSHNRARRWGPIHDTLLFYTVGPKFTWNRNVLPLGKDYVDRFYRHKDKRGRYRFSDLTGPGLRYGDTGQSWQGVDPSERGRHWGVPPDRALPPWFVFPKGYSSMTARERLDVLEAQGLVDWPDIDDGMPQFKRYLGKHSGMPLQDMILDVRPLSAKSPENTKYHTQKPLVLYERIITASSNPGDIVLDPFCGCATTPIAAERLGRQWIGMDIWDSAYQMVSDRMAEERMVSKQTAPRPGQQAFNATIHYETTPPPRTDADEIPVPDLRLRIQRPKEPWQMLTNREVRTVLGKAQEVDGLIGCAGCGRKLEGEFMELDHLQPKAEGGENHLLNRILLCRPCNGRKSNQLTMAGLRRENRKAGWMKNAWVAEQAQQRAFMRASWLRDNWGRRDELA